MMFKQPRIYLTSDWGARPAKVPPIYTGRPSEVIFHHTAGHHAEITNPFTESREELFAYARAIQNYHMDHNGWNDSGHNFLVGRNGDILVGRHMSYPAIKHGRMVISAHCVGHNGSPGIEHEHTGNESMTLKQFENSAWLCAWIHWCAGIKTVTVHPHGAFNPTSCPGVLLAQLPDYKKLVARILKKGEL